MSDYDDSASKSYGECMAEINQEVAVYWFFVCLSLTLTLVNMFVRQIYIGPDPSAAATEKLLKVVKLYYTTGPIKVLLGLLLILILQPTCPAGCSCGAALGHDIYGYVALALGLLWIHRGYKYQQLANSSTFQPGDGAECKPEILAGTEMV